MEPHSVFNSLREEAIPETQRYPRIKATDARANVDYGADLTPNEFLSLRASLSYLMTDDDYHSFAASLAFV